MMTREQIMLIFPLKKEWYEKIRSGEKTVEYREVKPYWTRRIQVAAKNCEWKFLDDKSGRYFIPCVLRLGYTKQQMTAYITKIEVVNGKDTDLHVDKPVYAIHLANVREEI